MCSLILASCQRDASGGILWPATLQEMEAVELCSRAGSFYREGPLARRQCNERGKWEEADFTGCTLSDSVSEPFLLLWLVIEDEEIGNRTLLENEVKGSLH